MKWTNLVQWDVVSRILPIVVFLVVGCPDDKSPATGGSNNASVANDTGSNTSVDSSNTSTGADLDASVDSTDGSEDGIILDAASNDIATTPNDVPANANPFEIATESCTEEIALELYKQRIEPLVSGVKVSSCNQCHLSGTDLSMYAKDTPCKTMACLLAQGLVDFTAPKDSKILEQIQKAEPQSALITEAVIEAEYDGFYEWIAYSAACHDTVCGNVNDACSGPAGGQGPTQNVLTPLGGCQHEQLVASFQAKIFKWESRCHGCHTNCESTLNAPCWLIDNYDKEDSKSITAAAEKTMFNLIGLKAINYDDPAKSNLILKPLIEEFGGIKHGGGPKFANLADPAYQDFLEWTEAYVACFSNTAVEKPVVEILSPLDKTKFYEGDTITLQGKATDAQDGLITGDQLVWTIDSSNEPLGTGNGPILVNAVLGKPIVTLTATDSEGNVGTRAIKLWIKSPPEP